MSDSLNSWGFSKLGVPFQFGGPYNKDYSILGGLYWVPPILGGKICLSVSCPG